MKFISLKFLSV